MNNLEYSPIANTELLNKLEIYFNMLNHPDVEISKEEAAEIAGLYYKENIVGKYTDEQINACMWMLT